MCRGHFPPVHHPWDCELRSRSGIPSHTLNDTHDLPGEFTGWSKNEGLRGKNLIIDPREDRQHECGGLACPRLRLSNHVIWWVGKKKGERLLLNFRGSHEVHVVNSTDELWGAKEVRVSSHLEIGDVEGRGIPFRRSSLINRNQ